MPPMTTTPAATKLFVREPAKVVAHSHYGLGSPALGTVVATGRRFILSELNTHRALSKNSGSSRAIPFPKQVQRIIDDLAYPEIWGSEKKGMQPGDEIEDVEEARALWLIASQEARKVAHQLKEMGVHKSIINRLLEPFMWHTVVMTGTAWQNFFNQRCSPLAQAEIRVMAEEIRTAFENSTPEQLEPGQWHLPFVDRREVDSEWTAVKVSAARCARVSYLTHAGVRDVNEDLRLYSDLVSAEPPHWSPLEHVATPWPENRQSTDLWFQDFVGDEVGVSTHHLPRVGNLVGWRSLRTTVEAFLGTRTYV